MDLIPDQRSSRTTAILMLAVVVILVYLVCFHWFIVAHAGYAGELGGLRDQLQRFQSVAAQREPLEDRLGSIRSTREDSDLFLSNEDFNEAAADLSNRLGQMVRTQAEDNCQIVSRQPVRPRVQERYERVTVNVRMRCQGEDLLLILHRLESEIPMVIVDDLNIIKPRTRRRISSADVDPSQLLDIRFNMSGYLK
jgi:general secretion pathway protein M